MGRRLTWLDEHDVGMEGTVDLDVAVTAILELPDQNDRASCAGHDGRRWVRAALKEDVGHSHGGLKNFTRWGLRSQAVPIVVEMLHGNDTIDHRPPCTLLINAVLFLAGAFGKR